MTLFSLVWLLQGGKGTLKKKLLHISGEGQQRVHDVDHHWVQIEPRRAAENQTPQRRPALQGCKQGGPGVEALAANLPTKRRPIWKFVCLREKQQQRLIQVRNNNETKTVLAALVGCVVCPVLCSQWQRQFGGQCMGKRDNKGSPRTSKERTRAAGQPERLFPAVFVPKMLRPPKFKTSICGILPKKALSIAQALGNSIFNVETGREGLPKKQSTLLACD